MPNPGTDKLVEFFCRGVKAASSGKLTLTEYLKKAEGKTEEQIVVVISEAVAQKENL